MTNLAEQTVSVRSGFPLTGYSERGGALPVEALWRKAAAAAWQGARGSGNRGSVGMRLKLIAVLALLTIGAAPAGGFDAAPWLADLAQARAAVAAKYANLEWLTRERGHDLDAAFGRAEARLRAAESEPEARRPFERLFEGFGDGHVAVRWPERASKAGRAGAAPGFCEALGYDARQAGPGPSAALPGYAALPGASSFPAGTVRSGARTLGVIRIGVFQPQGYPALCEAAVAGLGIDRAKPCDAACADRVLTEAYVRMGTELMARIDALKAAGAGVLLIDIAGNGGGSEWAEAAARMMTAKPITSAPRLFVRGPHWEKQGRELAAVLRAAAAGAEAADAARLRAWAAEADAIAAEARRDCSSGACPRLARAGYATGLVASAPSGSFAGREWAVNVFSPAQHHYRDGVWAGPLIVLVDDETWSAAEQFAAVLQDNRAGVVLGARTGGAGCGRTWGGTPTLLTHSGGTLELPDCARLRRDGSNEVAGVIPDVLTGMRASDGMGGQAKLIAAKLPEAVARAEALAAGGR